MWRLLLIYAQLHVLVLFIVIVFTGECIFDNSYSYNFGGLNSTGTIFLESDVYVSRGKSAVKVAGNVI